MNEPKSAPTEALRQQQAAHDAAARVHMQCATNHLRRAAAIARRLESPTDRSRRTRR